MVAGRVKLVTVCVILTVTFLGGLAVPVMGQIDVSSVTAKKEVLPDEFASLVFSIRNNSGSEKALDFELTIPSGWVAMDKPSSVVISAGGKESVFITVQVPASAKAGTYSVKLGASYGADEYFGEAQIQVEEVKGVELLAPDSRTVSGGTKFSYEFALTNTGNVTDTFYVEASSGQGWVEGISTEAIQLFPGSSKKFSVDISIPDDAGAGRDALTVKSTSARDKNITDSVTVFTTILPPSPQAVGGELYATLPATLQGGFNHNVGTGESNGSLKLTADGELGPGNLFLDIGLSDLYTENEIDWNALDYSEKNFKVSSGNVGYTFSDLVSVYGRGISTWINLESFNLYLVDLVDGVMSGGGSLTYHRDNLYLASSLANLSYSGSFVPTESLLGRFNPTEASSIEIEAAYTPYSGKNGGAFRTYGEVGLDSMGFEGEAFYIGTEFAGNDRGQKGFRLSQNSRGENYSEEFYYSYYYEPPEGIQTRSSVRRSRLAASLVFDILGSDETAEESPADGDLFFSGFAEFVEAEDTGSEPTLNETTQKVRGSITYRRDELEYSLEAVEERKTNFLSGQNFSYSNISQGFWYTYEGISFFAGVSSGLTENLTSGNTVSTSSSTQFKLETVRSPYVELSVKKSGGSISFDGKATVNASDNLELSVSGNASSASDSFGFSGSANFTYDFDLPLKFIITKGRIEGYIFIDENGNGEKDEGEEGVSGLVLALENNRVASGKDGYFKFSPLPPGTYELDLERLPAKYSPEMDLSRQVEVDRGEIKTIEISLVELGEAQVSVFEDSNRDGERGNGESGIKGVGISLNGEGVGEKRFTDDGGKVKYQGLVPGEYTLKLDRATLPARSQITTDNREISFELLGGQSREAEIGIYQEPQKIILGQPPEADFLYAPLTPEPETVVNFSGGLSSDPDGEIVKYEWDFQNDGEIDKEDKIVSYNFGETGKYEVLLKVTDDEGNTDFTTKTIEVVEERS